MTLPTVCRRCDGPCSCSLNDAWLAEEAALSAPRVARVAEPQPDYDWYATFKEMWKLSDADMSLGQSVVGGYALSFRCTFKTSGDEYQGIVAAKVCDHVHPSASAAIRCAAKTRETLAPVVFRKPLLIIRVDGEIGDDHDDFDKYPRHQIDWDDARMIEGAGGDAP